MKLRCRTLLSLLPLLWLCVGCDRKYSAQIDALESADPAKDAAAALAAGDLRFVGVMGVGEIVPGAPQWVLQSPHVHARFIPNTSDAIESNQHARLQKVAHDYAAKYNK